LATAHCSRRSEYPEPSNRILGGVACGAQGSA
jgi:hypothetical protein